MSFLVLDQESNQVPTQKRSEREDLTEGEFKTAREIQAIDYLKDLEEDEMSETEKNILKLDIETTFTSNRKTTKTSETKRTSPTPLRERNSDPLPLTLKEYFDRKLPRINYQKVNCKEPKETRKFAIPAFTLIQKPCGEILNPIIVNSYGISSKIVIPKHDSPVKKEDDEKEGITDETPPQKIYQPIFSRHRSLPRLGKNENPIKPKPLKGEES
mgnify:CR=1 FL=1